MLRISASKKARASKDLQEEIEHLIIKLETEHGEYGFIPPASIYHRFMTGLTGGKMSSSKPESHIALTEDPKEAGKKIMRAITGGRQSLAEQKKLGGEPEKCSIYEFLVFHLSDDDKELLELGCRMPLGQAHVRNVQEGCGRENRKLPTRAPSGPRGSSGKAAGVWDKGLKIRVDFHCLHALPLCNTRIFSISVSG